MKNAILIILLMHLAVYNSLACSCDKLKKLTRREVNKGEVVFVGTVVEIVQIDKYTMKTKFLIEEGLSNVTDLKEYEIWSNMDCVPAFVVGNRWYVFGKLYDEKHWVGICGRSAELSERTIPPNEYKKRYSRQAQRDFNSNQSRAKREIRFIRKTKSQYQE